DANKMWIVPSEFSKALEGLAALTGAAGNGSGGAGNGASGSEAIPTDGWFDSNLPPAAEQPEAGNLRASDLDPESLLAHQGLVAAAASAALDPGSSAAALDPAEPAGSASPTGSANGAEPESRPARLAEES
ncbi:MAG: hypothetical protein QOI26_1094, partial [Pseudonocardiales bacterium]|nr:hypothetical protein [Pseudonocardiales bacterium]